MSWQAGGACYSTQEAAAGAIASVQAGAIHATPAGLYSLHVVQFDATSIEYGFTAMDGGPAIANVLVPVTPVACGLLQLEDAQEMSWIVWGALAAVFAVKFLARGFWGAR